MDWDYIYAHPGEVGHWNTSNRIAIDLGGGDAASFTLEIAVGLQGPGDPYIDLGFSAKAGQNNPTHFSFISDVLSIAPALINAEGYAWTSATAAGRNARFTAGDFTDNKIFRAEYNGGTVFTDLNPVDSVPPDGYMPISGQVTSMQSMWGFTISAGAQANGSSDFTIIGTVIPEPATIALLGLGGLALIRKRRA